MALSSSTAVHQRLLELREMGLQVIMDDFGMGHGSMAYLQNAEFSIVKLDGSLVRPILANERSENIVRSIQQLADSLGFCLLAEFVETPEQRDRLAQLRVYPLPRVSVQPGPSAGRLYYVYPKNGGAARCACRRVRICASVL